MHEAHWGRPLHWQTVAGVSLPSLPTRIANLPGMAQNLQESASQSTILEIPYITSCQEKKCSEIASLNVVNLVFNKIQTVVYCYVSEVVSLTMAPFRFLQLQMFSQIFVIPLTRLSEKRRNTCYQWAVFWLNHLTLPYPNLCLFPCQYEQLNLNTEQDRYAHGTKYSVLAHHLNFNPVLAKNRAVRELDSCYLIGLFSLHEHIKCPTMIVRAVSCLGGHLNLDISTSETHEAQVPATREKGVSWWYRAGYS